MRFFEFFGIISSLETFVNENDDKKKRIERVLLNPLESEVYFLEDQFRFSFNRIIFFFLFRFVVIVSR